MSARQRNDYPPAPAYKWYVVAMLWWIAFFNYADRQAIFSVFPLLKRELHLSTVQLGLLGSSFAWVYGLSAPVAGNIVDRVRRKSAILGGPAASGASSAWRPRSRAISARLLFFRAAEGLGETLLLSRLDVAGQRLSRPGHTIARPRIPPDQRLHRHHRRRILRRPDRPALRLALVVRGLRRRWASCSVSF